MAVWAVPRVEPWIEVLTQALDLDAARVAEGTRRLDARWLQLPWLVRDLSGSCSWRYGQSGGTVAGRVALHAVVERRRQVPGAIAERIAQAASLDGRSRTAQTWLDRTLRIVAADETITCDGWRRNGAGLAIRLALLRPDPVRFKSWSTDLPGLPPAVWWAAATLCGWRHGYRALDRKFRGDASLQEFLATRALEASWPDGDSAALPPSRQSSLERRREEGCFTLAWRGHPVLRKRWHSRAKWYGTDLTNAVADRAARDLADRMEWPCIKRQLPLPEGRVGTVGSGHLLVDRDALVVKGEKSLLLPSGVDVVERLDPDEFVAGWQPRPASFPTRPRLLVASRNTTFRASCTSRISSRRTKRQGCWPALTEPSGARSFSVVSSITAGGTLTSSGRSTSRCALASYPSGAQELARRLVNEGFMKELPDQVIVNEYLGRQGISRHIDRKLAELRRACSNHQSARDMGHGVSTP